MTFDRFAPILIAAAACGAPAQPSTSTPGATEHREHVASGEHASGEPSEPVAQSSGEPDFDALTREAVALLEEYLRIQTINPPGNETAGARWLAQQLERAGIESQIFEPTEGRGNLYARVRGNGQQRPLILASHIDVVPADPARWSVDPYAGIERDGYVWGRGTLDMKGQAIVHLVTLLALQRSGIPLTRDIIFVANSDEESGQTGAEWLTREHPELLREAEFLLTEGMSHRVGEDGCTQYYAIDVTEKAALWLRLTARGAAGHGSRPTPDNAASRLVTALARIASHTTPIRLTPPAEQFFIALSQNESDPQRRSFLANPARALRTREGRAFFENERTFNALLRDTISLTVLRGSDKTNIIPGEANAELDIRLLGDSDPEGMLATIRSLIRDPTIEIESLVPVFRSGVSPTEGAVFDAVREVAALMDPGVPVASTMTTGATDSGFYRALGIHAYGIEPFRLSEEEESRVHGDDERVSLENMRFGVEFFYRTVARLVR